MHRKVIIPFILIACFSISFSHSLFQAEDPSIIKTIEPSSENYEHFNTMMDVLTHQRCLNCHPSDNVPKQGEDSHPHRFDIDRSNSVAATNCNTCHQASNNDYSGVPGAPHWALAPHNMRWEGLSRIEIAEAMLDPEKNGNRSHEDLLHHLTEHELVLWAWDPGLDINGKPREKPPHSKEKYITAVKEWIEAGAIIPKTDN
ncbi:hypothetical protein HZR84_00030 [Hyphobacterium sp. CCMP332]|nr:hypothetical protein HZR84_00030 [Hyphobacterium sp. CCMP332]